jgi:hypothetical protein
VSKRPLLIDTHALLWWVTDNPKLSAKAKAAMKGSLDTALRSSGVLDGHDTTQWIAGLAYIGKGMTTGIKKAPSRDLHEIEADNNQ